MYTETDRTWIRRYVGYGAIFLQAEPRLENAITATQAIVDGGGRPDASTENNIKGLLYGFAAVVGVPGVTPGAGSTTGAVFSTPAIKGLIQVEADIDNQDVLFGVSKVDGGEAVFDPAREVLRLRQKGFRMAGMLAKMLGMKGPRANMFAPQPVIVDDDPFQYSELRRGMHTGLP